MLTFRTFLLGNVFFSVSGFLPNILYDDLNKFIKRFDIHFMTIVWSDYDKLSLIGIKYRQLVQKCCTESNVAISVISFEALSSVDMTRGAVFLPAEVNNNLTVQLVNRSNENAPVFIFTLNETEIPDGLLKINFIPYRSRAYVIHPDEGDTARLILQEIYHVQHAGELVVNNVGERVEENGMPAWQFDRHCDLYRRRNLHESVVKIVYPSFMFAVFDPTGLMKAFRITESYILVSISKLNISIAPVIMYDRDLIGEPDDKGRWSGVIGYLQRREGDISVVGINPAAVMEPVVDMSYPYGTTLYRLYFRVPEYTYSLATMLRGFTFSTWVVCLASLLAFSFALYVTSSVTRAAHIDHGPRFDFTDCLLTSLGDYCVKGWYRVPNSLPGRIICFSSVFVGYILNMYYVSQLQAGLTARTGTMPFTDLDGLADTNSYGILLFGNSIPHEETRRATSGTMRRIHDVMEKHGDSIYTNFADGMSRVCKEDVALIGISKLCDDAAKKAECRITDTRESFYLRTVSFPVQKGYVFNDLWGYYLRRCVEGGFFSRDLPEIPNKSTDNFVVIELIDVIPFLVLYATAIVITLAVLIVEIIYFQFHLKINRANQSNEF